MQKSLILASRSPRRIQILTDLQVEFTIDPSDFAEQEESTDSIQLALHNATGKAKDVANRHANSIIIGVDTIGVVGDQILGKPRDRAHAKELIQAISGTTHQVISGISLIETGSAPGQVIKEASQTVSTTVTMSQLTDHELEIYLDSNDWHDKAAAYAIQGRGSLFVESIQGDYFNIVGLPVFSLNKLLKDFNISLM